MAEKDIYIALLVNSERKYCLSKSTAIVQNYTEYPNIYLSILYILMRNENSKKYYRILVFIIIHGKCVESAFWTAS